MNREQEETLRGYQEQIVASFFIIIAVLISISVVKDLYQQTKYGIKNPLTNKKSRLVSIIYLVTSLYFLYVVFKQYIKNRSKSNLIFLIAIELATIAALMRYIAIRKTTVENEGDLI